ncbi:MAG: phosphopantothenoylcysteine decarboxylase [Bacteroidales bacterium]|jgi:phosphopantothenoylcysteine decarboxylase/phosphopantothenate--cysteine ligase
MKLLKRLKNSSQKNFKPLKGKRLLVNAGPTQENIDPVRFISNHSSGKMGIAIADAAYESGAEVELVLGPVAIQPKNKKIRVTRVVSAASMAEACISLFPGCDIAILAAAVADFTPESFSEKKIKKGEGEFVIKLKPTTDIAAELGKFKREGQIIAGFALETDNELENAREKLLRKNMDIIVLNSLRDEGAGFGHDTNRITIIDRYNNIDKFGLKSKEEAARDILDKIIEITG